MKTSKGGRKIIESSMVEIVTPEKLIEALMPWDGDTLFVCVRDQKGKVIIIAEALQYLKKDFKKVWH